MQIVSTAIAGAFVIRHDVHADTRGLFKRQYCELEFAEAKLNTRWIQANHSATFGRGSIRGMHFQRPPHAEAKLVSCPYGRAFDVAVDVRSGSPTFLHWVAAEIADDLSFYIPEGCAHGFQALTEEIHLIYMHSSCYAADSEGGIRFDDPAVGIRWPLPVAAISDRDCAFPPIGEAFEGILL